MIPKIIHYCWFGGNPLPESAKKCMESWKKFCPDYEIKEWNESNFDINFCQYSKEAYSEKKYAFVSDVARLKVLVDCGGIYMDTDVEVIKPLDEFLNCTAFSGFEDNGNIPTGIMGCEREYPMFAKLLNEYNNKRFIQENGKFDLTTNVMMITEYCSKYGFVPNNTLQTVEELTLYPRDWFCPKDLITNEIIITDNTHTIHHFAGSWLPARNATIRDLKVKINNIFGNKMAIFITNNIIFYFFEAFYTEGLYGIKMRFEKRLHHK